MRENITSAPFKVLFTVVLTGFLPACVTWSHPKTSSSFAHTTTLNAFAGTYRNRADSGDHQVHFLTDALGFGLGFQSSAEALCVNVSIPDDRTAIVRTLPDSAIERRYIKEKDFHVENGKIKLKKNWSVNSGDVELIGLGYESDWIGVDSSGDGKRERTEAEAAIVMFIPAAFAAHDDFRFPKLSGATPERTIVDSVYEGTLPCTDCDGVKTTLTLHQSCSGEPMGYSLQQIHLKGKNQNQTATSGTWHFEESRPLASSVRSLVLEQPDGKIRRFSFGYMDLTELESSGKPIGDNLNHSLQIE